MGTFTSGQVWRISRQDRHDLDLEQGHTTRCIQERGRTGGAAGLPNGQLRRGDRRSGRPHHPTGWPTSHIFIGDPNCGVRRDRHDIGRSNWQRHQRKAGI